MNIIPIELEIDTLTESGANQKVVKKKVLEVLVWVDQYMTRLSSKKVES